MADAVLPRSRRDFNIAIFCALEKEFNAAKLILDEIWDDKILGFKKRSEGDDNLPYTLGRVCKKHNVVLIQLRSAGMGKGAAASSASYLRGSYPSVRIALLVGICGGIPGTGKDEILLGDVIITSSSQVRQYDFGKMTLNGFRIRDSDHGLMTNPTVDLFVSRLKSEERAKELTASLAKALLALQSRRPGKYEHPGYDKDVLFPSFYRHKHHVSPPCICKNYPLTQNAICQAAIEESCNEVQCDLTKMVQPRPRLQKVKDALQFGDPQGLHLPDIKHGVMGCGDAVVKSGEERDRIARETHAIALEMESAGIFQSLPGIVIKSVCDYADSHKNKDWQEYASAVAAATAKALLEQMDSVEYEGAERMHNGNTRYLDMKDSTWGHLHTLNKHSCVRYSLCDEFLGREDALKQIESALLGDAKFNRQKRFVVHGMGGMGKTQLCLRFARIFEHRFWGIFLVGASSRATAEEHFTDIASRLGSPAPSFDSGIELLRREVRPWLLILDNADDPNDDIHKYFPPTVRGNILITTRLIKWNGECHQTVGSLELKIMDVEKSIDLFLLSAGKNRGHESNRILAKPIVEELGRLPLALNVAAAPILAGSWQLENYWTFYSDRKQELMSRVFTDRENKYNRSIYATFDTSRKIMLEQKDFKSDIAQRAIELLELCSFLNFYDIPKKVIFMAPPIKNQGSIWRYLGYPLLFLPWNGRENKARAPPKVADKLTPEEIRRALSDIATLSPVMREEEEEKRQLLNSEALRLLCASGLGSLTENGTFSMHPLVHEWAQLRLTPDSIQRARWAAGVALANTLTWERIPELWRQLYPHIEFYLKSGIISDSKRKTLTRDQAEVAGKFSLVCSECGLFSLARNLAQEAVQTMRYHGEAHDSDRLRSLVNLAEVFVQRREYDNAVGLSKEALESGREALGEGHTLMLKSLSTYAISLNGLGLYEESEKISRVCIERYEQAIGKKSYDSLAWVEMKCNLATALRNQAKFSEATDLMNDAYSWRFENLGEKHPDTIKSMVYLANILTDDGCIQKAVDKLRIALDLQKSILGEEHPDTLGTMSDLARLLMKLEFTSEAEILTQEAIKGMKQRMGNGNLSTIDVMYSRALMLEKKKEYKKAEELYQKLMEGYKAHFREDHPDVLKTMISLARMIENQGSQRYNEAESMYTTTIRRLIERHGSIHPDIITCRANLALLLEKRMDFQVAEEMHRLVEQDLSISSRNLDINGLNCLRNFSKFLRSRGKYPEAEMRARMAMTGLQEILGPEKRETLTCAHTLALTLEAQDKDYEALQLYERVFVGYEKLGDRLLPRCSQELKQLREKIKTKETASSAKRLTIEEGQERELGKTDENFQPKSFKRYAESISGGGMIRTNEKKLMLENDELQYSREAKPQIATVKVR